MRFQRSKRRYAAGVAAPRVLDNPSTGERILIRESESSEELLVFELFLQPGGHVPAGHVHPRQHERFTVLDGRVRFRIRGRSVLVRAGDSLSIAEGTPHWFGNPGPRAAHVRVEVTPALRMAQLLETTVTRATASASWLERALDYILLPLDFQPELGVPNVPAALVTALLSPLAWLRQRLRVA